MEARSVLFTTDAVGGVWHYTIELARELKKRGARVYIATLGPAPSSWQRRQAEDVGELFESTYRLEWMDDPWDDVQRSQEWILCLERELRPDIMHLGGYAHGAIQTQAPRLVVAHSCVFSWWRSVLETSPPARYDAYHRQVRHGLNNADHILAPSATMLAHLRRHYGPLTPPQSVVHNGVTLGDWVSAPKKESLVLAAGRLWDEAKNLGMLQEVAPFLSWPLKIAGDPLPPNRRHGTFHDALLLGSLPSAQLSEWMSRASIFVHPAKYEPFGLAPLQAAAAGCALVLSNIPSLREIWGDAAVYVSPCDSQSMRETLKALILDQRLRETMQTRAYQRSQNYSSSRMATGTLKVYRQLRQHHGRIPTQSAKQS